MQYWLVCPLGSTEQQLRGKEQEIRVKEQEIRAKDHELTQLPSLRDEVCHMCMYLDTVLYICVDMYIHICIRTVGWSNVHSLNVEFY